jgi:hypothetical protein
MRPKKVGWEDVITTCTDPVSPAKLPADEFGGHITFIEVPSVSSDGSHDAFPAEKNPFSRA